jgi:hypothetical protein
MQNPTREQVAVALFGLLSAVPGILYASRRPTTEPNVNQQPALYIGSPEENYAYPNGTATPPMITLDFQVYLYIDAGKDPNVIPDTLLNNLLDNIEAALQGAPSNNYYQTLSGIVNHAQIEGTIHRVPGWLDGQGMALFTIRVLVPS